MTVVTTGVVVATDASSSPAVVYTDVEVRDQVLAPGGSADVGRGTVILRALAPDGVTTPYRTDTFASLMAEETIVVPAEHSGDWKKTLAPTPLLAPIGSYYEAVRQFGGRTDVVRFAVPGDQASVQLNSVRL